MPEEGRSHSVRRRVSTTGVRERTARLSIPPRTTGTIVPLPDRAEMEMSVRRPPAPAASIFAAAAACPTSGVDSRLLSAVHRLWCQTQKPGTTP